MTRTTIDHEKRERELQDAARQWIQLGYDVVLNKTGKSHPGPGWPTRAPLKLDQVEAQVSGISRIFVRGTKDHATLDLDPKRDPDDTSLEPWTPAIHRALGFGTTADGRPSKPVSHIYLASPNIPKDFTVNANGDVEIRGQKHVTSAAPSLHEKSGEELALLPQHGFNAFGAFQWDLITARVNEVRALIQIGKVWLLPPAADRRMTRHDLVLYLAGYLLKAAWQPDDVLKLVATVAEMTGDPDGVRGDYERAVKNTSEGLKAGKAIAGYGPLADAFGIDWAQNLGSWLELPSEATFRARHGHNEFWAVYPESKFIFIPTNQLWRAGVVDAATGPVNIGTRKNPKWISGSEWLNERRAVDQMTWVPGEPRIIEDKVLRDGGWVPELGKWVYNRYVPPNPPDGNPAKAGPWLRLVQRLYPDGWQHIVQWLAHHVQRPGEKVNHALVLGGVPGIGKDTILHPVWEAVGPWNVGEVAPKNIMERFNPFVMNVILRVSEARDLGEIGRYAFIDSMKTYEAAPPAVLRVDEKNVNEFKVPNIVGVVYTTNYRDALFLSRDDRRHFVTFSERKPRGSFQRYFTRLYRWFDREGGNGHVAAYLAAYDLSGFDPKAPPPKTAAFWEMVRAGESPEKYELQDVLDALKNPDAVTVEMITRAAINATVMKDGDTTLRAEDMLIMSTLADQLRDRKFARSVPRWMDEAGYVRVENPYAKDGVWKVKKRRTTIYAKATLTVEARLAAAAELAKT